MNRSFALLVTAFAWSIAPAVAWAQSCDKTLIIDTADWSAAGAWSPLGEPLSTQRVCIPAGDVVHVTTSSATCESIQIGSGAMMKISNDGNLTLYADSTVNGKIEFLNDGELTIADDLTIDGDGGFIGQNQGNNGVIKGSGILTIEPTGASNGDPADSVRITTYNGPMDIKVELVNNAWVQADGYILTLSTNPKRGNGFWHATEENLAGGNSKIKVDVEVTGSGTWLVDDAIGEIEFNVACDELTGPIKLTANGELDINQDLCTTGHLTFNDGTIDVATDRTAKFSGTCP